jgi:uncharacterized membrane protein YfcA
MAMINAARSALGWIFRDRKTGRIVIAQFPNLPLGVWIGASLIRRVLRPSDHWNTFLFVVAAAALLVWAGDEIVRGVNPWRRVLGAGVAVALIASWAAAV